MMRTKIMAKPETPIERIKITVCLTQADADVLQDLIKRTGAYTLSEAVRDAIRLASSIEKESAKISGVSIRGRSTAAAPCREE